MDERTGDPVDEHSPRRRPHVLVNVAMTADGKIDTVERRGTRISSPEDVAAVDALRAEVDAVMVGGATFLAEDPRLTVRDEALVAARVARGAAPQPAKVAIVSQLPAAPSAESRFVHEGGGEVVVCTTERCPDAAIASWRAVGVDVLVAGTDRVDLAVVLEALAGRGIARLLVEGGGTLIAALFALGLVDEFRQYLAPFVVGGTDAPTPLDGPGLLARGESAGRVELELLDSARLGPGMALRYRVVPRGAD